ncbi:unnamed protein product, partial [marine sediment metagenome]
MRQTVVGGGVPHLFGAYLYTRYGMDYHYGKVSHPQGPLHL